MNPENEALWLDSALASWRVGPAPYTRPGPGEVVIKVRAVAVNPVDALSGIARRFVYPWLRYPAILGTDVVGDVVEVGDDVVRFSAGDRVVGLATGQERFRNSNAHGAFQRYVILDGQLTTPIPPAMAVTDVVVLPLGATTAAAGWFQPDHLDLILPSSRAPQRDETVVVWGGLRASAATPSSSPAAPATAWSRRHHPTITTTCGPSAPPKPSTIAGQTPCSSGSTPFRVTVSLEQSRSAPAHSRRRPDSRAQPRARVASRRHTQRPRRQRGNWQPARLVFTFPPSGAALRPRTTLVRPSSPTSCPPPFADGRYQPAPGADITGKGLAAIPAALATLRAGVSARKLVIEL